MDPDVSFLRHNMALQTYHHLVHLQRSWHMQAPCGKSAYKLDVHQSFALSIWLASLLRSPITALHILKRAI